jgi:hydrogenase expression/formation protein HypC
MCLAVPGLICELRDNKNAMVDFMGIKKAIAIDLIENARVGDYVIVHAGFAINKLDKEEARETLLFFSELLGRHK